MERGEGREELERNGGTLISLAASVRINGLAGSRIHGSRRDKRIRDFGNLVETNGSRGCSWQMSVARVFLRVLRPSLFHRPILTTAPIPSPSSSISSAPSVSSEIPVPFSLLRGGSRLKSSPHSFAKWK